MSRQAALWTLAALLGISLTAGITWATSQLASQHIGLSSEPISAGARLAPKVLRKANRSQPPQSRPKHSTRPTRSTPTKRSVPTTKIGSPTPPSQTQGSAYPQQSTSSAPTVTTTQNAVKRKSSSSSDNGQDGQNRHTTQSTEQPSQPNRSSGGGQESTQGSSGQTGEGHRDD
jgi:hypothetical protein